MNPPPAFFALAGNVGSTYSKTCSAIAGMFDRSGRIFAPAGMMWSVEMLSPSRIRTSPSITSFGGFATGSGAMFGPRMTLTEARSFGGRSNPLVSTGYLAGYSNVGSFPRSRESAILPPIDVAYADTDLQTSDRSAGAH